MILVKFSIDGLRNQTRGIFTGRYFFLKKQTARTLTTYAAARQEKPLAKKAMDDRLDLLLFLQGELESRGMDSALPVISNRELADAYGWKNHLRVNYKRFLEMVSTLHVIADIKDRHGSKFFVFNRSEIDRQLQLTMAKS